MKDLEYFCLEFDVSVLRKKMSAANANGVPSPIEVAVFSSSFTSNLLKCQYIGVRQYIGALTQDDTPCIILSVHRSTDASMRPDLC